MSEVTTAVAPAPAIAPQTVANQTLSQVPAPAAPVAPAVASAPQDWTSSLNDELRGYVQNKGFKDPGAILESYRNFEKLQGVPQERILKLPENIDLSTPEGRAVFERLGAPKDAKEYVIELPKENADPKLAESFRELAYKNGLTTKQAESIVKGWNEFQANTVNAGKENYAVKINDQVEGLKKEWGAAHDQNLNIARAGARVLGLEEGQVDALQSAMGYDGTMKLLHKFGISTGEHNFIGGKSAGGSVLTPDQAKSQISSLQADPGFAKRLLSKDADAIRQWDNLHKMAHPGMSTV